MKTFFSRLTMLVFALASLTAQAQTIVVDKAVARATVGKMPKHRAWRFTPCRWKVM